MSSPRTSQPAPTPRRGRFALALVALIVGAAFIAVAVGRPSVAPVPSRPVAAATSPSAGTSAASSAGPSHTASASAPEPARPAVAVSSLERAVLREVNRFRADPRGYARELADERQWFNGRLYEPPGPIPLQTNEGVAALDEAIRDLEAASPLPGVERSDGLARAARDHALDLANHGTRGHVGSDGSTSRARIERYGRFTGMAGEVISFGYDTAGEVVRQLIVDDGVPDRGHRINLLRPEFRVAGVACGRHRSMRFLCVIDLATTFQDGGR